MKSALANFFEGSGSIVLAFVVLVGGGTVGAWLIWLASRAFQAG